MKSKLSKAMTKSWKDPQIRARRMKGMRAAARKKTKRRS